MEKFIDSYGTKRKGVKRSCLTCKKHFLTRHDQQSKYCSIKCSAKARENKVCCRCSECGNEFYRKESSLERSRSGLYFCDRKCKEKAQMIGGIKEIMPPHYGTSKNNYREQFTDEEFVCIRCGYDEFTCSVQIHHKDLDKANNTKENLIPLCANCHVGLHCGLWLIEELNGGVAQ